MDEVYANEDKSNSNNNRSYSIVLCQRTYFVARQASSKTNKTRNTNKNKKVSILIYLRSNIDNSETFLTCQNRPHDFRRDTASKTKRQGRT